MKRALVGALALLSLSGCWLIGFDSISPQEQRQRREARARVSPLATPIQHRHFVRVEITPDGLFHVEGHRGGIAAVHDLPFPETPSTAWVLASSAPTREALASLGTLLDRTRAVGGVLSAFVRSSTPPPPDATHPSTPRLAVVDSAGFVALSARREGAPEKVPAASVREQLPPDGCPASESIGLSAAGASTAQLMDAAGFLAAAGCRVVLVVGPAGATSP